MNRIIALILSIILVISLAACSTTTVKEDKESAEVVVFAAASMTETLEEIEKSYITAHPDVKLTFNFDSSGTLKTQIEEGAVCDLFISAAQKQMNGLEEGGYIDAATRVDLLENKVALCVAENSKADIATYEDMKSHLEAGDILMAIGNEDVPVGQYTRKIFSYYGLDEKALSDKPEFIARRKEWVSKIIGHTHKTPFARIKTQFADITADEARAKGYIKGSRKKEEVFKLLKRVTDSTTIYKKQKIDRQDAIKMTFDHAAWMKEEMKVMLEEESARAILVGDGRNESDEDKINELCIRPIVSDDDLYTIKYTVNVANNETEENAVIDAAIKAQDDYQGSGSITMFMDTTTVTKLLLVKDAMGHRLYKSLAELATAMSVDEVVKVPKGIIPSNIYGIGVDLADYNIGTDAGGEVNWFDNFDIDFNQYKYLAETMFSGALVRPYSAFVLKKNA